VQKTNSLFVTVGVLVAIISLGLTMASAQNKQAPGSTQNIKIELTKEERAFLKAHPVIRFGTDGSWDPFVRRGTAGTLNGLDVDFINNINQVSGANIELVTGKWVDIVNKAKTHEIDGLATSAALKKRESYFNFTNSYISVFTMVILRSDSTLSVTGLSDLKGKTVAFQKENAFIRSLLESYPEINTIESPSELDAVEVMVKGRADAVIGNVAIYNTILRKFKQSIKIGYFIYDKPTNLLYSIRKDWPLLTSIINKSLTALPQEKKNRIFARWFGFSLAEFDLGKDAKHVSLTAREQAWIKEHPEIRLGVDPAWQPVEFVDKKGQHQGISSDYVRILNSRLGLNMKIVPNLSWTQVMDAVPQRDVDVLPGVAKTPEREKHLKYSEPYIYIDWVIVTRTDSPKISSLADLKGRITAVDEGYPSQYRIEKQFPEIPLLLEKTTLDVLQSVIDGKADAAVVELSAASLIIHGYRIHSLRVDKHVFQNNDPIAFAVRNDWPELVQILSKGLASISQDERKMIEQKWLAVPISVGFTKKDMLRIVLYVVAVMGMFLVFFLFWNRRLKKEVTGRIKTEKMLRESEDKFRSFAEQSLVGIYLISGDIFKYVNPKFAEIFGYSVDECLNNLHFQQLVHPEDLATVEKQVGRRLSGEAKAVRYSFRGIKKSGKTIHVEIFGSSMVLKGKTVATGTMLDITERKRAEEALRESESLHRLHFVNVSDVIYSVDPELKIINISPSVERVLGYKPEELIGRPFQELNLLAPEYLEQAASDTMRILGGERISSAVYQFIARDGKKKWGEVSGAPLIRDGQIVALVSVARDITKRKQAEEALRESEEKFRLLSEQNLLGVIIIQDDLVKYANKVACEITEYSIEEVLDWKPNEFGKLFHPDDLEFVMEQAQKKQEGTEDVVTHYSYSMLTKSGKVKWVDQYSKTITFGGKTADLITIIDIAERKQAEEALQESEEKYRSMMEAMKDAAYICSPELRIEYMNPAMIDRVGRDATGEICHKAIYDMDEKCSWCIIDRIQKKEHVEYEVADPKDNRYYSITNSPIFHSDGTVSKLSIFHDITEVKMMEKERIAIEAKLQQSLKMESIGTLAGGIAHDFNNILSSVIGYTELALDEVDINTVLADNLQEVYTAGIRAKELVKQILAFARQATEEIKPVQVNLIVKEALKLIRSSLPTTIEIRQDIESHSLIMGDPTQVHQILMNLCTNAAHAMEEEGGVLDLRLTDVQLDADFTKIHDDLKPGDYLKLSVTDTGFGISPEVMSSIFEPYFTTKAPGEGTGMGLAMVHGIVKQYGGKIMVESEVERGSTFNVYLPVTKKHVIEKSYQTEVLPSGTEGILVVDDELPIANIYRRILQSLGYRVTIRTSSVEALELFRSKPNDFDIVITDMTMPNMTGDKLAAELMKVRPDVPVVLCTGYSKRMSEETASSSGIKAFVKKPIGKTDLAMTVRKVLDEAKGSA